LKELNKKLEEAEIDIKFERFYSGNCYNEQYYRNYLGKTEFLFAFNDSSPNYTDSATIFKPFLNTQHSIKLDINAAIHQEFFVRE